MSFVLKFRLHFSQTANLASGNLTVSLCLNPGGTNERQFCILLAMGALASVWLYDLPRVKLLEDTTFAVKEMSD